MPTTPVQALPYPALSDAANGPVAVQNLALALEDYKTLVRCTSSTRPAHVEGRVIYETDTDQLLVSTGTEWRLFYDKTDLSPGQGGFVLQNGVVTAGEGVTLSRRGGQATLALYVQSPGAITAAHAICSIPAGYRPPRSMRGVMNKTDGTTVRMCLDMPAAHVRSEDGAPAGGLIYGTLSWAIYS